MWVIIVVGVYRCSAYISDFEEDTADKVEESEPESKEEDTTDLPPDDKVRILIMNQGYQSIYHTELVIECS